MRHCEINIHATFRKTTIIFAASAFGVLIPLMTIFNGDLTWQTLTNRLPRNCAADDKARNEANGKIRLSHFEQIRDGLNLSTAARREALAEGSAEERAAIACRSSGKRAKVALHCRWLAGLPAPFYEYCATFTQAKEWAADRARVGNVPIYHFRFGEKVPVGTDGFVITESRFFRTRAISGRFSNRDFSVPAVRLTPAAAAIMARVSTSRK